jgi:hypothetical protein
LALYAFLKLRGKQRGNRPPRVKGLPIIGNAMDINENNLFDKLYSFSEKYGEIFELKILHQTFVSLNSESLIRKALATEPYTRFMNERTKFFYGESMLYGSQSVFSYGDPYSKVYNGMRKGKCHLKLSFSLLLKKNLQTISLQYSQSFI